MTFKASFFSALLFSLCLAPGFVKSSDAATLPELPRSFMSTPYAPPTGKIITVNAGGNFQAALNNAKLGDTIVLQAGATFTGPFTLPNKTSGSGWIYIRSSAYASLPPPGSRVSPADSVNMPKIIVNEGGGSTIQTAPQSHHFRFVGIEFKPVPGKFVYNLLTIGNRDTSHETLPHDIIFDRCIVRGDPVKGGRRGIAISGMHIAVIDSHVSGFFEAGADSQALWGYQGNGPVKIVNNFLEAASENIMFGGADPTIPNSVPADIEIRRNHFFKPLSWIGAGLNVKNLLEFKNAERVLVEGNIFENCFLDGQAGFAIIITPRNQDGKAPWSITQDITIRLNKFINLGSGIALAGRDGNYPLVSTVTKRLLVENNVIEVTRLGNADGRIFQITGGPIDVTIRHNTGFTPSTGNAVLSFTENPIKSDQFDFRDNILSNGVTGFDGTGTGTGINTLNRYFTNYTFTKNAIIGGSDKYPSGNFFPPNNAAVGFVNFAAGDYKLAAGSAYRNAASDGKDLGADIAALNAALAGDQPAARIEQNNASIKPK